MSSDDADRYRKQAEECRQQAQKAVSLLDKEAWLRVAEEWLNLAQSTDETGGACATAKFQTETLPAGLTRGLPRLVQRPWASVQRSQRINACQFKRSYYSSWPSSLPVFRLTKCTLAHAGQAIPSYSLSGAS
jgi:hypothetical protein